MAANMSMTVSGKWWYADNGPAAEAYRKKMRAKANALAQKFACHVEIYDREDCILDWVEYEPERTSE